MHSSLQTLSTQMTHIDIYNQNVRRRWTQSVLDFLVGTWTTFFSHNIFMLAEYNDTTLPVKYNIKGCFSYELKKSSVWFVLVLSSKKQISLICLSFEFKKTNRFDLFSFEFKKQIGFICFSFGFENMNFICIVLGSKN